MVSHSRILQVRATDPDHTSAVWQNVVMIIWRHETKAAAVLGARELQRDLAASYPAGIALLQVVEENASLPDAPARDALGLMLKDGSSYIKCSAVVHEGEGFKASAVRGVVTGLTLFARPGFPHKIFSTTDAGLRWLAANGPTVDGNPIEVAGLLRSFQELRDRFNQFGSATSSL